MPTVDEREEKDMPTVDDFCKALKNQEKKEVFDQIRQSINASRLLNPLLNVSLPKEMNEKLAVFRMPTISECIVCDSIEDISNFSKNNNSCAEKVGDKDV